MTEIAPGDIVECVSTHPIRLIRHGVGVYIGEATGFEWFHDGESLGVTGSAMPQSYVTRIGHDDDVNYARTIAATRSGRGSGFRSETIPHGDSWQALTESDSESLAESEGVTTPEETSEAVSGDPVDSQDPFPVGAKVLVVTPQWGHDDVEASERRTGTIESCPVHDFGGSIRSVVGVDPDDPSYGWSYSVSDLKRATAYVSGPMTGYDDYNFPAFNAAADELRAAGWEVLNPADKGVIDGWDWADYLRYDLEEIASKATHIYTLPGWRESKGARLEMHVCEELGITWLNPDNGEEAKRRFIEGSERLLPGLPIEVERDAFARTFNGDAGVRQVMTGEVRKVSSTGGEKGVKPERYDLIPWDAMAEVARVYAFGAEKYADHNWRKGYPWSSSIAADFRHEAAFAMGEDRDPESGLLHPAHQVFHALCQIAWSLDRKRYGQHDDRYRLGLS